MARVLLGAGGMKTTTAWGWMVLVAVAPFAIACGGPSSELPEGDDTAAHQNAAIVDGHPVPDDHFQSVVYLEDDKYACTGTKVGPRHILTAAHCATTEDDPKQLTPGYRPNDTLRVVWANDTGATNGKEVKVAIERTEVHPRYDGGGFGGIYTPDLAVVITKAPIPFIPSAYVDSKHVSDDEHITIMGYGLESTSQDLDLPWATAPGPGRLMFADTLSIDPSVGFFTDADVFFGTDPLLGPATARGDSGGPVYRNGAVVGVISFGKPFVMDWHTRLSDEEDYGVPTWLKDNGVYVDDPQGPLKETIDCSATSGPEETFGSADDEGEAVFGTVCGNMEAGEVLLRDQSIKSCDGRFELVMQGDGNLVLYQVGVKALWASNTFGTGDEWAIMQSDGNLVVYGPSGALWGAGTQGVPCARLALQDDGNLVIYAGDSPIWASGTCCL